MEKKGKIKLFIKILLFVLVAFIDNIKVTSVAIAFSNIQQAITTLSLYGTTPKTVVGVVENDLVNCCQNGENLVGYRK